MTEIEKEELETNWELEDNSSEDYQEEDDQDQDWDEEQITWEQAQEWKKKAERAERAEKRLVELKKQLKDKLVKVDTPISSKDEVKKILAEEKFYDKNPEAEAYRNKIEEYQNKWLSLDDAYLLASKKDREIDQNRQVYWKSIIKGATVSDSFSLITIDEYDRMSDAQINEYEAKTKAKYGGVRFK